MPRNVDLAQRHHLDLNRAWTVSASASDAVAAITKGSRRAALELGHEADNQPQVIDLPGGNMYGCRSITLGEATATTPPLIKRVPSHFLSYAKRISIPANWAGMTIFLHLDNARYHVTVTLDGHEVGHYLGGLEPHRFDITSFVSPGASAVLLITVGDTGVSGHRPFDPYNYTGTRLPTCKEIANNHVHPVNYGGGDRALGAVRLEAVPMVRTESVLINSSVALGTITSTIVVVNDGGKPWKGRLHCVAVDGKDLVDEAVNIPARGSKKISRTVAWTDARCWDLDDPHRYELRTTLTTSGRTLVDLHRDHFGFREFTIDGADFKLNGIKIHLHGQSGHTSPDHDAFTLAEKISYLKAWKKEGNITHFRLHAKPQSREWVIAADRVGLLVTTETALWTTGFHSFDWAGSEQACLANVRTHFMDGLVRRDRNNPSVVIWSLSNEMSPITADDLSQPKMAAITRVFKNILEEAKKEDPSRIIQMSSAMDFLGNLALYNLHYPKSWQAFPDYPRTSYWLDEGFNFPWYGPGRKNLPAWTWRRDKPLLFGEFICVYGVTPDTLATIIGEEAYEHADFGRPLVHAKLWPMEINAYRQQDVSGFNAWSLMFPEVADTVALMKQPDVQAHNHALRPLALICHTYREQWLVGQEVRLDLSLHNDVRTTQRLGVTLTLRSGRRELWRQEWPARTLTAAGVERFVTCIKLRSDWGPGSMTLAAEVTAGGRVVDTWTRPIEVSLLQAAAASASDQNKNKNSLAFYDPDGRISALLAPHALNGVTFLRSPAEVAASSAKTIWFHFEFARIHNDEWRALHAILAPRIAAGLRVVLDHPTFEALAALPVPLKHLQGFARQDERALELTYAYSVAPHHPLMRGLGDGDFRLWGDDSLIALNTIAVPEDGNARPLLLAQLEHHLGTPLLELASGCGSYVISTLEMLEKIGDHPAPQRLLLHLADTPVTTPLRALSVAAPSDTWRIMREVGLTGRNCDPVRAITSGLAFIDGSFLADEHLPHLANALKAGGTVVLHDLGQKRTAAVLAALHLPGTVLAGSLAADLSDTIRHSHRLADGMSSNHLYWIVNKSSVAPWTLAPLHPEPASACIRLPKGATATHLTRRGAVTVYQVGKGTLVIDNLRWHLADFDEPERPRRYLARLLDNLGVQLEHGANQRQSHDHETEAERRERGSF